MLALGAELTDVNAALFDPVHQFAGCIPGIHEVLRRQGLLAGRWCLDPHEELSPGQMAAIDRVLARYPHLADDAFRPGASGPVDGVRAAQLRIECNAETPRCAIVLLIAACVPGLATQPAARPADLVLLDGRVVTVDDRFSMATALAVRDGRFIAVGSNDEARAYIGSTTRVIAGRGRTVIPGIIDTHVHALDVAAAEATQPFRNLRSIGELQDWIRNEAQRRPQEAWIWTPRVFPTRLRERRFPTRQELDLAAPRHPVVVDSAYAFSLNSVALRAAGITRDSADPPGGAIVKDAAGEPTGLLRNVGGLLARFRPGVGPSPPRDARAGPSAVPGRGHHERDRARRLARGLSDLRGAEGRKPFAPESDGDHQGSSRGRFGRRRALRPGLPMRFGDGDDWLKAGPLKIVADGGILIGTSFMREPYGWARGSSTP